MNEKQYHVMKRFNVGNLASLSLGLIPETVKENSKWFTNRKCISSRLFKESQFWRNNNFKSNVFFHAVVK
jgi:hypothetical protein